MWNWCNRSSDNGNQKSTCPAYGGPTNESSQTPGGVSDVSLRDRIIGAAFVLIVLAMQIRWMGPAIIFLSGGLMLAYAVWVTARWKNDAAEVLPIYLLAVTVQCLHFTEEYVTGFQHKFPELFGYDWSDPRFVTFNMLWIAAFALAGLGIYRRAASASKAGIGPFHLSSSTSAQRVMSVRSVASVRNNTA